MLIETGAGGAEEPLRLLAAVVRFQAGLAAEPARVAGRRVADGAAGRLAAGRFPLLDLDVAPAPLARGLPAAVASLCRPEGAVPGLLAAAGHAAAAAPEPERVRLAGEWLEDPTALDPLLAFWVSVPGGAVLEAARAVIATPSRDEWTGAACPACGGLPQVSVIAPESGEFLGGSPRSLVCGRCAGWWTFPRAMCVWCGEGDPRRLAPFVPDAPRSDRPADALAPARIDACETCRTYVKTFDLRQPGGAAVVPLVDDVATVTLDLWAREQGLGRPLVSLAGV